MKEDINFRIIKKLDARTYGIYVSGFLKDAIREEFHREHGRWKFKETYDRLIEKYAGKEDSEK